MRNELRPLPYTYFDDMGDPLGQPHKTDDAKISNLIFLLDVHASSVLSTHNNIKFYHSQACAYKKIIYHVVTMSWHYNNITVANICSLINVEEEMLQSR